LHGRHPPSSNAQSGKAVYHLLMSVHGRSFDPTRQPPQPVGPVVDYSLARRSVLMSVRRGALGTTDVCDAHPELMRAAKHIGDPLPEPCPICSHDTLRTVRYVYGDELRTNNGRVVYPAEWLTELSRSHEHFICYVVEVCVDCSWNHLMRSYSAGRKYAQRPPSTAQPRSRGERL
jgi:uncharacterized protein DUF5318